MNRLNPQRKLQSNDLILAIITVIMTVAGVGMAFNCIDDRKVGSGFMFKDGLEQLLFAVVSLLVYAVFAYVFKKEWLQKFRSLGIPVLCAAGIVLLLLVKVFGIEVNGARRWLAVMGMTFQPSEFCKPILCLLLAYSVNEITYRRNIDLRKTALILIAVVVMIFLVYESNLSTAILYVLVVLMTAFYAGINDAVTLSCFFIAFVVGFFKVRFGDEFRRSRFAACVDPLSYATGDGNQIVASLSAISKAGMCGCGFGNGNIKHFIPEPANDYVMTTIIEETGCAGALIVLLCYCVLFWRGIYIISCCKNKFCKTLAFSCMLFITLQAFLNICVVLNMGPSTGVCLPFISSGGSSIVSTLAMVGLMQFALRFSRYSSREINGEKRVLKKSKKYYTSRENNGYI